MSFMAVYYVAICVYSIIYRAKRKEGGGREGCGKSVIITGERVDGLPLLTLSLSL